MPGLVVPRVGSELCICTCFVPNTYSFRLMHESREPNYQSTLDLWHFPVSRGKFVRKKFIPLYP